MLNTSPLIKDNGLAFYFPNRLKQAISFACSNPRIEEIRIRANAPIQVITSAGEYILRGESAMQYIITPEDCMNIYMALCEQSLYACEEDTRQGFLTIPGGYRVGICGKVLLENGTIKRFTAVNALNIRISKQCIGCADTVMPNIYTQHGVKSILIISAPAIGKTTLLRDIARQLSQISQNPPIKVCIVDERSEIAGCYNGIPQNTMGMRCDCLDNCPKAIGITMAIRSLSPSVLITDEIGKPEDAKAILDARTCGISVIASAHAGSISDAVKRPVISELIRQRVFDGIVHISIHKSVRKYSYFDISEVQL
ncbi:MAG TPA: stage III sporulation protein AA [Clostridiales bacterium]|nr:stage III sporulation protein AA [Clostridiales bacterium]